jgi:hypothetical protein
MTWRRESVSGDYASGERGTHLLESGECSIGSLSRDLERIQESRNRLVEGPRSDDSLGDVKGVGGSRADDGIRVDQGASDDVDDHAFVRLERCLVRVRHDFREREADSLSLASIRSRHRLLQVGDDFSEDGLSELAAGIGKASSSSLPLFDSWAGERADDDLHCRKHLLVYDEEREV